MGIFGCWGAEPTAGGLAAGPGGGQGGGASLLRYRRLKLPILAFSHVTSNMKVKFSFWALR